MQLTFRSLAMFLILCSTVWSQQTLTVPVPFTTIQSAIAAAAPGDTVLVSPGTYNETVDFLGKAIAVVAMNGPLATVIDRQQQGRCVLFTSNEGQGSVLEGFTITGGQAPHAPNVTSGIGLDGQDGGGILCQGGPTIINCIIRGNKAGNGGDGSFFEPAGDGGRGGGIFVSGPAQLLNCLIYGNNAGAPGTITFPGTPGQGAGVAAANITAGSPVSMVNCTVTGNGFGNASTGGILIDTVFPIGLVFFVTNSIVWNNDGLELQGNSSSYFVNYSDVEGGSPGTSNISANPLFANPALSDYHIALGSPCIGAGFNGVPLSPATDLEGNPRIAYGVVDMGPYEVLDISASPSIAGNIGIGVGGPFDTLTVNQQAGGADRRISLGIGASFTIEMMQPPTTLMPVSFVIFGFVGVPGISDPIDLPLGIGSMAFAPCPLAPGSPGLFTLTDNIGIPPCPSLLPSTPTPWAFSAPGGIPAATTVTLQGVVLDLAMNLSVTNGVIVAVQ